MRSPIRNRTLRYRRLALALAPVLLATLLLARPLRLERVFRLFESHAREGADAPGPTAAAAAPQAELGTGGAQESEGSTDLVVRVEPGFEPAAPRRRPKVYPGRWEDREAAIAEGAPSEGSAAERDRLAKMSPRERVLHTTKRGLLTEFGPAAGGRRIEFLESGPYLLCLQQSRRYDAALRLSDLAEITTSLLAALERRFGRTLAVEKFRESPAVIFIFESREAYMTYGATLQLPPYAGGHFERSGTKRVVLYNDCPDPYESLIHQCVYQIVDRARTVHGQSGLPRYWLMEGLATWFEVFRRDPGQGFVFGAVASRSYLPMVKGALRAKTFVPLGDLVERDWEAIVKAEGRDPSGARIQVDSAESWSLVHFLHEFDGGRYRAGFEECLRREVAGTAGPGTFKDVIGDPQAIQAEWMEYVRGLK